MFAVAQNFLPILNSEAGLCLTQENWQEVNVIAASYYLEHLLYKPGIGILKQISNLERYLASPEIIVLNASSLVIKKEDFIVLKSPYDGSKTKITCFDLLDLINQLNPKAVILPKNIMKHLPQFWQHWQQSIFPFFHINDVKTQTVEQTYGVYFYGEKDRELFNQWPGLPRYLIGDFELELIKDLQAQGIECIETDQPAKDARQGKVYSQAGVIDLTDLKTQMQFETIDAACICPTCKQKFSRAYLHHLLQHTPLLCQRFLIQHNVFFAQNCN